MTILGSGIDWNGPPPLAPEEPSADERALELVAQMRGALIDAVAALPTPVVEVANADLTDVVQAVQGLKGPATAEEIATALARVLTPAPPAIDRTDEVVAALAELAEKLDWRMQGVAFGGGGGGGTVSLDAASLAALESIDASDPNKREAVAYAEIRTASDTITPSAGKAIKVLKVQVLQNPDNATANPVSLSFASIGTFVTGWVYSDSNEWVGAVDEPLSITLGSALPVSVNIRYKEMI